MAIRDYVIYSKHLVDEFGSIVAWEKEDLVEPGKPNAAGWLLPTHNNIHRRYPEVAILIPDTVGRACGGLCASCQRMYDFQGGRLNFDLDKLKPKSSWSKKLERLMDYFESPMEVTPEVSKAVKELISAGWTITNQHVLTTASSRRGHVAKLRQVLNEIGILSYYCFSVKGYMENYHNFATNARAIQEQMEEKVFGRIPEENYDAVRELPNDAENMIQNVTDLTKSAGLLFLSTDRNVLNLPGVGKSLTFRVIGITRYGRRILEFDHDATRTHSPIIKKLGKMVIIESKSISEYLKQLEDIGEDISEYESIWGYSLGETENRLPLYEYPKYNFKVTDKITNLEL